MKKTSFFFLALIIIVVSGSGCGNDTIQGIVNNITGKQTFKITATILSGIEYKSTIKVDDGAVTYTDSLGNEGGGTISGTHITVNFSDVNGNLGSAEFDFSEDFKSVSGELHLADGTDISLSGSSEEI